MDTTISIVVGGVKQVITWKEHCDKAASKANELQNRSKEYKTLFFDGSKPHTDVLFKVVQEIEHVVRDYRKKESSFAAMSHKLFFQQSRFIAKFETLSNELDRAVNLMNLLIANDTNRIATEDHTIVVNSNRMIFELLQKLEKFNDPSGVTSASEIDDFAAISTSAVSKPSTRGREVDSSTVEVLSILQNLENTKVTVENIPVLITNIANIAESISSIQSFLKEINDSDSYFGGGSRTASALPTSAVAGLHVTTVDESILKQLKLMESKLMENIKKELKKPQDASKASSIDDIKEAVEVFSSTSEAVKDLQRTVKAIKMSSNVIGSTKVR